MTRIASVAAIVACAGCIIPETGIVVEGEFDNPGAVRIVEPTPITPRADAACGNLDGFAFCPNVPDTIPSGVLVIEGAPLCRCPQGDANAPRSFDVFVEDPDTDADGRPADAILGAFLLDVPAGTTDPGQHLAYTALLAPDEPARLFAGGDVLAIERENPNLRSWTVGAFRESLDLCNDNDGAQLTAGLHDLRLVVTDRPWWAPPVLDDAGRPVLGEDGTPMRQDPVSGVPDLAAGATYAVKSWVFSCLESTDPELGATCNCIVPTEEP